MAQPDTLLEVELERDDENATLFEAEKKAFWAFTSASGAVDDGSLQLQSTA